MGVAIFYGTIRGAMVTPIGTPVFRAGVTVAMLLAKAMRYYRSRLSCMHAQMWARNTSKARAREYAAAAEEGHTRKTERGRARKQSRRARRARRRRQDVPRRQGGVANLLCRWGADEARFISEDRTYHRSGKTILGLRVRSTSAKRSPPMSQACFMAACDTPAPSFDRSEHVTRHFACRGALPPVEHLPEEEVEQPRKQRRNNHRNLRQKVRRGQEPADIEHHKLQWKTSRTLHPANRTKSYYKLVLLY